MNNDLHPVLSIRLFTDQKCFGPGVAELLDNVRQLHSLRAAAQSMGMAYSKAWSITKTAEEGLGFKLLRSSTGGRNGGGAVLTPEAETLLAAYRAYCADVRAYAAARYETQFKFLREQPCRNNEMSDAEC